MNYLIIPLTIITIVVFSVLVVFYKEICLLKRNIASLRNSHDLLCIDILKHKWESENPESFILGQKTEHGRCVRINTIRPTTLLPIQFRREYVFEEKDNVTKIVK